MAMMEAGHFKHFSEITEPDHAGGKAASLIRLTAAGFPVPEARVSMPAALDAFLGELGSKWEELKAALLKASSLEALTEVHHRIQTLFLGQPMDEALLEQVWNFCQSVGGSVAVRSSGTQEDMADRSFAGQYESFLEVESRARLAECIRLCWASLFNPRVVSYCREQGLDPMKGRLAVIIQKMVPASVSGVLFTVDPKTGRDTEMVIEAVSGLGEALVSGAVDPELVVVNWYRDAVLSKAGAGKAPGTALPVPEGWEYMNSPAYADHRLEPGGIQGKLELLNAAELAALIQLGLKIQMHYGLPQDIEWAYSEGHLYVLQSRPVTSIHYAVGHVWTNADFRDGGIASEIATPFMWSLYQRVFTESIDLFFKGCKMYPPQRPEKWADWFFGYPYWNLSVAKEGTSKIPGFKEREFDADLGIAPAYEGDGRTTGITPLSLVRGIMILTAINKRIARIVPFNQEHLKWAEARHQELSALDLKTLSDTALGELYTTLIRDDYFRNECAYFTTVYDNSNAATLFNDAFDKYNRKQKEPIDKLRLISGLEDLSHLLPARDLWQIRNQVIGSGAVSFFMDKTPEVLEQRFRRMLDRDPSSRGWFFEWSDAGDGVENPAVAARHAGPGEAFPCLMELRAFVKKYAYHSRRELNILIPDWREDSTQVFEMLKSILVQPDDKAPLNIQAEQKARYETELSKLDKKGLRKKLARHRTLLWWREKMRDYSTRFYHHARRVSMEMGRRLQQAGLVRQPDQVFFLRAEELAGFWGTRSEGVYLALIKANYQFWRSFRNVDKPNELWPSSLNPTQLPDPDPNAISLSGIGGAPGRVQGVACVLDSIFEGENLPEGAILVTRFTDPAWTPLFARISGLVTETGGTLSHGAVVSREYGIPAVLSVKGAIQRIESGMEIIVDGSRGVVELPEHAKEGTDPNL